MHGSPTPIVFPPWYFWFFIFGIVAVGVVALSCTIISVVSAVCARRVKERELAAALLRDLLQEHSLAPVEIERLMQCYWKLGTYWGRFGRLRAEALPAAKLGGKQV